MYSSNRTPLADGDNALASLVKLAVDYDLAGAVMPNDLLQVGLFGSSVIIITALLALILPSATSISHSSFYLILGSSIASLASLMREIAAPALITGGVLLVLDAYLMLVRTSARWRSIVIVQAALAGVGGVICTAFLGLVILNIVIWVAICALALAIFGMILGAIAAGS